MRRKFIFYRYQGVALKSNFISLIILSCGLICPVFWSYNSYSNILNYYRYLLSYSLLTLYLITCNQDNHFQFNWFNLYV